MKDVTGRTLKVGDKVAYLIPRYRHLLIGTVEKLTPKGVTVNGTNRSSCMVSYISTEDTELLDLMQKVTDDESTSKGFGLYDVRKYLKEQLDAHIKETTKEVSDGS